APGDSPVPQLEDRKCRRQKRADYHRQHQHLAEVRSTPLIVTNQRAGFNCHDAHHLFSLATGYLTCHEIRSYLPATNTRRTILPLPSSICEACASLSSQVSKRRDD